MLDAPNEHDTVKASYWLPAIEQSARPGLLPDEVEDVYEFRVGEDSIVVTASRGHVEVAPGPAADPADVVITTDHETFAKLGRGAISPLEAIEAGRLWVDGDAAAAERCAALFGDAGEDEPEREGEPEPTSVAGGGGT